MIFDSVYYIGTSLYCENTEPFLASSEKDSDGDRPSHQETSNNITIPPMVTPSKRRGESCASLSNKKSTDVHQASSSKSKDIKSVRKGQLHSEGEDTIAKGKHSR